MLTVDSGAAYVESGFSRTLRLQPDHATYSTVTDFARFLGWSTSQPRRTAM
jgi:hypothetical protein